MADPAHLALFCAAALVLAATPGPGIFSVAARTLAGGRAEGIASSLGMGLGGMVHVTVASAAGAIREGAASRPRLIRRLREGSGAAMVVLGLGLAMVKRPAS